MRRKLNDLFIYHAQLDAAPVIELLVSFEKGRLGHIRKHITKQNVNNSLGVCGFLPLELAIIYDHKHIFNYLTYELNANLSIKNKSFETMPFVALAFQRRHYLFELLNLDTSTLYDCTREAQRTLMHEAAISGDNDTTHKLLNEFGFYRNLNETELGHLLYDKYGCTPLYYACWFGSADIVEQLLDAFYNDSDKLKESTRAAKLIKFKDASLAISILHRKFECAKLLLSRATISSSATELDAWFSASMHLLDESDLAEMCDLLHELALNGAKFSSNLFLYLDSMDKMMHFKMYKELMPPDWVRRDNLSLHEVANYYFDYNEYTSYFVKSLTFLCGYNLPKLFINESKCELFLKTCFMKINELFIVNNNWHIIDECLTRRRFTTTTATNNNNNNNIQQDYEDYFKFNRESIEWFLFDFIKFLNALRTNSLAFKFFKNKKFFNFLKKIKLVYYLIEQCMYSTSARFYPILAANDFHASQSGQNTARSFAGKRLSAFLVDCDEQFSIQRGSSLKSVAQPLSLANLAKNKIKASLKYLDADLINRLVLPKYAINYLSADLAKGLANSFERANMNKAFNIQKKSTVQSLKTRIVLS